MNWLSATLITLATAAAMEFVAWFSHKYIMHGFGWAWHRDHHEPHDNKLEKNDLFGISAPCFRSRCSRSAIRW